MPLGQITSILPTLLMSKCSLRAAHGQSRLGLSLFTLLSLLAAAVAALDAPVHLELLLEEEVVVEGLPAHLQQLTQHFWAQPKR